MPSFGSLYGIYSTIYRKRRDRCTKREDVDAEEFKNE